MKTGGNMHLIFNEDAVVWLEKNGFDAEKRENAVELLSRIKKKWNNHEHSHIEVPKNTPKDVAALVYLLSSITDADGTIVCFRDHDLISVPEDARKRFPEFIKLEELESVNAKLEKAKFGRTHMDARRRGSVVKG